MNIFWVYFPHFWYWCTVSPQNLRNTTYPERQLGDTADNVRVIILCHRDILNSRLWGHFAGHLAGTTLHDPHDMHRSGLHTQTGNHGNNHQTLRNIPSSQVYCISNIFTWSIYYCFEMKDTFLKSHSRLHTTLPSRLLVGIYAYVRSKLTECCLKFMTLTAIHFHSSSTHELRYLKTDMGIFVNKLGHVKRHYCWNLYTMKFTSWWHRSQPGIVLKIQFVC